MQQPAIAARRRSNFRVEIPLRRRALAVMDARKPEFYRSPMQFPSGGCAPYIITGLLLRSCALRSEFSRSSHRFIAR